MSAVPYRFEHNLKRIIDGKKMVDNMRLMDGSKGISYKRVIVNGDKVWKSFGRETTAGNFAVSVNINGKEENITFEDEKKFIAFLKKHKQLSFVVDYMAKDRKTTLKNLTPTAKAARAKRMKKKSQKSKKSKKSKRKSRKSKKSKRKSRKSKRSKRKSKRSKRKSKRKSRKSKRKSKSSKRKSRRSRRRR